MPAAELGDLEFPTRSQLDAVLALGGVIQVEASRGCNAGCTFCEARATTWRPRPAGHLVAELKLLADRYPGALVYMVDNIFLGFSADGSHLERGREIAREIIAQGIDVRFVIQDRSANVDTETFALLKQAGLCEVYLGIESFADSALLAIGKGSDASAEGNARALRLLGELEIYTQFGFLPFHEKATFDELRTSLHGLRDACLDNPYLHVSNFNELIPYEGTYLARRYQRDHGELPPPADPWRYADDRVSVRAGLDVAVQRRPLAGDGAGLPCHPATGLPARPVADAAGQEPGVHFVGRGTAAAGRRRRGFRHRRGSVPAGGGRRDSRHRRQPAGLAAEPGEGGNAGRAHPHRRRAGYRVRRFSSS